LSRRYRCSGGFAGDSQIRIAGISGGGPIIGRITDEHPYNHLVFRRVPPVD